VRCARRAEWRASDGFDYYRALATVTQPVLAMVGAADRLMAPAADAAGLVAGMPDVDFRVVGRHSGLSIDPSHMGLVLDAEARPAWDQVADFILALPRR
jgi:hypothetical protein